MVPYSFHIIPCLLYTSSRPLTEKYAAEFHGEVIMQYQDCNGREPVYRCTAPDGTAFALMCMRVGAPSACGIMEEMIPHGVKKFLMLGSCGALDHAITAGHIPVSYTHLRHISGAKPVTSLMICAPDLRAFSATSG